MDRALWILSSRQSMDDAFSSGERREEKRPMGDGFVPREHNLTGQPARRFNGMSAHKRQILFLPANRRKRIFGNVTLETYVAVSRTDSRNDATLVTKSFMDICAANTIFQNVAGVARVILIPALVTS